MIFLIDDPKLVIKWKKGRMEDSDLKKNNRFRRIAIFLLFLSTLTILSACSVFESSEQRQERQAIEREERRQAQEAEFVARDIEIYKPKYLSNVDLAREQIALLEKLMSNYPEHLRNNHWLETLQNSFDTAYSIEDAPWYPKWEIFRNRNMRWEAHVNIHQSDIDAEVEAQQDEQLMEMVNRVKEVVAAYTPLGLSPQVPRVYSTEFNRRRIYIEERFPYYRDWHGEHWFRWYDSIEQLYELVLGDILIMKETYGLAAQYDAAERARIAANARNRAQRIRQGWEIPWWYLGGSWGW